MWDLFNPASCEGGNVCGQAWGHQWWEHLIGLHQLVGIPASLWCLWSARFLKDKVFSPKLLSINQPTHLQFNMAQETEKAIAPHSSTRDWKIPWTEEPGGLQSMGSQRVGHDWATSLSLFTFLHWRRKWQPTPVFLPGESQGRGSLVSCRLWGRTESDTTEVT